MQMKSSMTSIRVIYVHRERAKVDFKSREVNCLKECALALIVCGEVSVGHELGFQCPTLSRDL